MSHRRTHQHPAQHHLAQYWPRAIPGPVALLAISALSSTAFAAATIDEKANFLKNHVRPETIHRSFHAAEGMWVDCVDIHKQPSLMAPDMAGHVIEAPPPRATAATTAATGPTSDKIARFDVELHANELDENGVIRHCDPGTIPIRRVTAADLARFATLADFHKKGRGHPFATSSADTPNPKFYEHAGSAQSVPNWGLQFFMNIWNPSTASTDHSISQMWVLNSAITDSAEAGWTVDPPQFGDNKTHFFIFWTDNGYGTTSGNGGCYNLNCSGFVQVNNSLPLGGAYANTSSAGGTQYWAEVAWEKSSTTANWWLFYQGTAIGYIPASKYTHGMQTQADLVEWGGEVNSPNNPPGGTHTSTQMGSGQFPSAGCAEAAFQGHVQYINLNYNTIDPTPTGNVLDTSSSCYNYSTGYETANTCFIGTQSAFQNGFFEFFGGPGRSSSCPTTPPGD